MRESNGNDTPSIIADGGVDKRAAQEADAIARLSTGPRRTIAMIAACPFPSHQGTQVFIRHLANALASAGHAVHLLTYDESEPLGDARLDPRVAWHRAPGPKVGLRSGPSIARLAADASLLRSTLALLGERDVDVLHVHNVEGLAIGAVASGLTGVPLVYHAHTRLEVELPLYTRSAIGRAAAKAIGFSFERTLPQAAKAVICFDGDQAARFKRAGVSSSKLHVIPIGLAMDELVATAATTGKGRTRATKTGGPAERRLIYAGNPDAYQNLDILRAAFAKLRAEDPTLTLRLISNHPRETFGALGKDPGVEHHGFASPTELAEQLRQGTVGLITRTVSVGAPVKALTYLSAGLPVVACASGAENLLSGFPEVCTLTPPTADAVATAARDALTRKPHALDFQRARRAFEITDQIPTYEAVYLAVTALPTN